MINSNLKTQVQARINAITTGTTLAELLRIRQAAKGLNCDETLLNNEVTVKLNALSGATSLDDLVAAGVLTDGPSNVLHYQVPHAVMPGDDLWIDGLGLVTDRQYPYTAMASAAEAGGDEGSASTTVANSFKPGVVRAGNDMTSFLLALSDGNWLFGIGSELDTPATIYGVKLYVMSSDLSRIISATTVELKQSASFTSQYTYAVGVREVSANSFRLYYWQAPVSTGNNLVSLAFHTLSYNTSTKAFSAAAGSVVHTLASGQFKTTGTGVLRHNQGQRFTPLCSSNENSLCLDMQGGTVTTYTGPGINADAITEFDETSAGNEWGIIKNGSGTPFLAKGGTSTTKALPANLVSDGCFGAGWTIRMLEPRRFMAKRANAGVCTVKLVAFDTTYDTATIWTLDSAHPDTASSVIGAAFKRIDGLYIVENNAVGPSQFYWDGASAPTQYRTHRKTFKNLGNIKAGCLQSNHKVMRSGFAETYNNTGSTLYGSAFLCVNAAAYLPWAPAKIGKALTNTAASGIAEVELYDNSRYVGDDLRTGAEAPVSQMVMTLLPFDSKPYKVAQSILNGSLTEDDLHDTPHVAEFYQLWYASSIASAGYGGAIAFDGGKPGYAYSQRDANTDMSACFLSLHSFYRSETNSGTPSNTGVFKFSSARPFVVFVTGQQSYVAEGE